MKLAKSKKIIISVLSLFLFTSNITPMQPVKAEEDTITRYIKNAYTSGAYMFDDNGWLRYGIPLENETRFMWELSEHRQGITIKNVATNRYISMHNSLLLKVKTELLEEPNDNTYFDFDIHYENDESQNIIAKSGDFQGYAFHLEGIETGYVASELLPGGQLLWGNANWTLMSADDLNFQSFVRDGFVIANALNKKYLYADGANVAFGISSAPNDAYIWQISGSNNQKVIKNKLTGTYLNYAGNNVNLSNNQVNYDLGLALQSQININATQGLLINDVNDARPVIGTNVNNLSDKWNIIPASQVANVVGDLKLDSNVYYNLKNAWFEMYLFELDNQAKYGNTSPSDHASQWKISYDEVSKKTYLQNRETGHYLIGSNTSSNGLTIVSEQTAYWKLLRPQNDLYPDAIIFKDSVVNNWYLHMESLIGVAENSSAVQPGWGTPHWIPIIADTSSTSETEQVEPSSSYVRIQSKYKQNLYLYATATGSLAYGNIASNDARSHFSFKATTGGYHIYNREYETYLKNMGNGIIKAFKNVEDVAIGGLFNVYTYKDIHLIENSDSDLPYYIQPFINIADKTGLANSKLVSIDAKTSQWMLEDAPDSIKGSDKQTEKDVILTTINENRLFEITYQNSRLDNHYEIEHYGRFIKVKVSGSNDYLYVKNGIIKHGSSTNIFDQKFLFEVEMFATSLLLKQDTITLLAKPIRQTMTYNRAQAYIYNNYIQWSIFAPSSGSYSLKFNSSGEKHIIRVNGIIAHRDINNDSSVDVSLNKGNNLISVNKESTISSLTIDHIIGRNYYGSTPTYVTYEAEQAATNGEVLYPSTEYLTIESESTNRSAVVLSKTTEFVKFTLKEATNAIVLRYSIPDALSGGGQNQTISFYVDGQKHSEPTLSSRQTWLYGPYPWSNDPSKGSPHVFYDELRIKLDQTYPSGTAFTFQKDISNYASSYTIDTLETYLIDDPYLAPENSINITSLGAIANDGLDDTAALVNAFQQASVQLKPIYIPEGNYDFNGITNLLYNNVTIHGAGNWYTNLNNLNLFIGANNTSIYNLSMTGNATVRRDGVDKAALEMMGDGYQGLTVANLWISHYKAGMWLNFVDNIHLSGNIIRYTYADGVNLHAGIVNGLLEQNDVQSTGDDSFGLWSETYPNTDIRILYNSIRNPWLANAIGLYGGRNITVSNNHLKDNVYAGAGVNISTDFQPVIFSGKIEVIQNLFEQAGSENASQQIGSIWLNTVNGYDNRALTIIKDNVILNAPFQGISIAGGGYASATISKNTIYNSATFGVYIDATAKGDFILTDNQIKQSGQEMIVNDGSLNNVSLIINNDYYNYRAQSKLGLNITLASLGSLLLIGDVWLLIYLLKRKKRSHL